MDLRFFGIIAFVWLLLQIQLGRGICLIYSLLGVPINALLIGTLGSYIGKKESELKSWEMRRIA